MQDSKIDILQKVLFGDPDLREEYLRKYRPIEKYETLNYFNWFYFDIKYVIENIEQLTSSYFRKVLDMAEDFELFLRKRIINFDNKDDILNFLDTKIYIFDPKSFRNNEFLKIYDRIKNEVTRDSLKTSRDPKKIVIIILKMANKEPNNDIESQLKFYFKIIDNEKRKSYLALKEIIINIQNLLLIERSKLIDGNHEDLKRLGKIRAENNKSTNRESTEKGIKKILEYFHDIEGEPIFINNYQIDRLSSILASYFKGESPEFSKGEIQTHQKFKVGNSAPIFRIIYECFSEVDFGFIKSKSYFELIKCIDFFSEKDNSYIYRATRTNKYQEFVRNLSDFLSDQ